MHLHARTNSEVIFLEKYHILNTSTKLSPYGETGAHLVVKPIEKYQIALDRRGYRNRVGKCLYTLGVVACVTMAFTNDSRF
jgi:hypothetical protein